MKKFILGLLVSAMTTVNAYNRLYLENQSGSKVGVQVNYGSEKVLGHNVRVFLGTIIKNEKFPSAVVDSLKIRSIGRLWSSLYTSLDLSDIEAQMLLWCGQRVARCNNDAVLIINPSTYGWKISLQWESSNSVENFSIKDYRTVNEVVNTINQYVQQEDFNQVTMLINRYKTLLSQIWSNGQMTAIVTGSHPGADVHQKNAARKFINQALEKLNM